jgi:hypothetical protein
MLTIDTQTAVAQLMQDAPRMISAVDDVLESGVRSSSVTAKACEVLEEMLRLAVAVPDVRERLQLLIDVLAAHVHVSGALEGRLAALKASARSLAGPSAVSPQWWVVLNVPPDAALEDIERAGKRLAKLRHPDLGGTHEQMTRLNAALTEARRAVAARSER